MTFLLWQFIYLPLGLLLLFPLAIQYDRGGVWRLVLPFTLIALAVDIWLNFTTLAIYTWDFPKVFEWTFSTRLTRLKSNTDWRGPIARVLADYLNFWKPGHV